MAPATISEAGLVLDQAGEWGDLLISQEWHRPGTTGSMTGLAIGLQDRFDILVERDLPGLRQQSRRQGQEEEKRDESRPGHGLHSYILEVTQTLQRLRIILFYRESR